MFGKFIKALLDHNREHNRRPHTQLDLQKWSGINQGYISHCLAGEKPYQNPRLSLVVQYAKGFRLTLKEFIEAYETFLDTGTLVLPQKPRGRKKKEYPRISWKELRSRIQGKL